MSKIIITKHAYRRAKERMGLSKKALDRLVEKVLIEGTHQRNAKGRLDKLFSALFFHSGTYPDNIRIYGEFIYIFSGLTLITIINLDNRYKKYIK